ncbi:flagellin [Halobacterium noricense]
MFIAMVLVAAIAAGVLINTAGVLQTQAEDTGQDSTDQVANNLNIIGAVGDISETDADAPEIVNTTDQSVDQNFTTFNNSTDIDEPVGHTIKLAVQKSPGAADIDLAGLSIQYVGGDSFANLVHATQADSPVITNSTSGEPIIEPGDNGDAAYFVGQITAESQDTVMTSESDRYEVIIPLQQAYNSSTNENGEVGESIDDSLNPTEGYDNSNLGVLHESANVELTITTESGSQRYVNLQMPDSLVGDEGSTVQL